MKIILRLQWSPQKSKIIVLDGYAENDLNLTYIGGSPETAVSGVSNLQLSQAWLIDKSENN